MRYGITIVCLLALILCGCAEHVDIAEPLDVPPVDIEPTPEISGLWERIEEFTDTVTIVTQDTLTQTLMIDRVWVTNLELSLDLFAVNFFDDTDGQRRLMVRREGDIAIRGDTLVAEVYSVYPRRLLRRTIVRFEDRGHRLVMAQIYDSGSDRQNRFQPPIDIDDIDTGEGLFWLRDAPQGDFDDREVRELGTFELSD